MNAVSCTSYVKHSFLERQMLAISGKANFWGTILFISSLFVPKILAHSGIFSCFRNKKVKNLRDMNLPGSCQKTRFFVTSHFADRDPAPAYLDEIERQPQKRASLGTQGTAGRQENSLGSKKGGKLSRAYEEDDSEDNDFRSHFQNLALANLKADGLGNILNLGANRQKYLAYLHKNQSKTFKNLFIEVLNREEEGLLIDCLKLMDREELDEILANFSNFKLKFGDKTILSHKVILETLLGDYFKRLFASEMLEVNYGEIHLQEEDYELFESIINALAFDKPLIVNGDNLRGYLEISEKYFLSTLKRQCEKFIISNLTDFEDLSEIFELADRYHLKTILDKLVRKALGEKDQSKWDFLSPYLPKIQKLQIKGFYNQSLLNQCIGLKKLSIASEDKTFLQSLHYFPHLKSVSIICSELKDSDLENLQRLQWPCCKMTLTLNLK